MCSQQFLPFPSFCACMRAGAYALSYEFFNRFLDKSLCLFARIFFYYKHAYSTQHESVKVISGFFV